MCSSFSLSTRLIQVAACYYSTSFPFPAKWHSMRCVTSSSSNHQWGTFGWLHYQFFWILLLQTFTCTFSHGCVFTSYQGTVSCKFSSVQSLSCVRLFATPWITALQASLSITNSQSSLRLTSIESVMPSHPWSSPSPPAPNPSQHQSLFQWVNSSHEVAKVLEFQL